MTRDPRRIVAACAILVITVAASVCYLVYPAFAHWFNGSDGRWYEGLVTGFALGWLGFRAGGKS
jgi:hypothetical protein